MTTVLVLAGGSPHAHDYVTIGDALVRLLAASGHDVSLARHPDAAADALREGGVDVLVVHGLWWRMLDDAYEPWREFAYVTPTATRDALDAFVRRGGGLVALHTAAICFDDWPGWGDVVGGSWRWGTSSHPPLGPVSARVVTDHPVVAGVAPVIELVDEVYGDLDLRDGIETLAVARRSADDDEQPVVWAHRWGAGRVVFDGFGHDGASIAHPDNAALVLRAVDWVAPPHRVAVASGGGAS